ncbi:MAG: TolC family protein [Flavobacteriaceae bacterium]|nr:TolC family protein [Flavobacteriaceae bacterium]
MNFNFKEIYKARITLMSFLILGFSYSQQLPNQITLNQAVDLGIENNAAVRNATLEIQKTYKQQWQSFADGLPQIKGNLSYQNYLEQPVALIPAQFFGGKEGEFSEVVFGTKQNFVASFNIDQILFDGSYLLLLQASRVVLEVSQNALSKTKLEIRKNVIQTYVNVLLSRANIDFISENLNTLEENLEEMEKLFESGFVEQENVEQIRLSVSEQKNQLRYAQRLEEIALDLLKHLLGYPSDFSIELTDKLEQVISAAIALTVVSDNTSLVGSSDKNIDVRIAENNVRAQFLEYKNEQAKSFPVVKAFLNGNYTGNSNEFTFLKREQKWFGTAAFGITADIPIFSSLSRNASVQKAKINWQQSQITFEDTKKQVELNIRRTLSDLQLAAETLQTGKENMELAQRISEKNQIKFLEGLATSFEYREARSQLFLAQQKYLQAVLDLINNKVELDNLLDTSL